MTFWKSFKRFMCGVERPTLDQLVNDEIEKCVEKVMPTLVEGAVADFLKSNPSMQLTRTGFMWALVLGFEKRWPDLPRDAAISCARDCLEVPHGTRGYDWTALAAEQLVLEYVVEHGEAA